MTRTTLSALTLAAVLALGTPSAQAQFIAPSPVAPGYYYPGYFNNGLGYNPGFNPYTGGVTLGRFNRFEPFGGFSRGETGFNLYNGNQYSYREFGSSYLNRFGTEAQIYNPYTNQYAWQRWYR